MSHILFFDVNFSLDLKKKNVAAVNNTTNGIFPYHLRLILK